MLQALYIYFSHLVLLWHRDHALQIPLLFDYRHKRYELSIQHGLQPAYAYKMNLRFENSCGFHGQLDTYRFL